MTEKERVEEYFRKVEAGEVTPIILFGAFGNSENSTGFVEREIFPKEGGSHLKMLGCTYPMKGCPLGTISIPVLESLGLAKGMIIRVTAEMVKSWYWRISLLFFWLFSRKRFYYFVNYYIDLIYQKTAGLHIYEKHRYNQAGREISRAWLAAVEKEAKAENLVKYTPQEAAKDKKLRLLVPLAKLGEVVVLFFEFDMAYRLATQDGFGAIQGAKLSAKDKTMLLLGTMRQRYNGYVSEKMAVIEKAAAILLRHPIIKRIVHNFFEELDIEKVKPDEADWYYSLRRTDYNYGGLSVEEREEEAQRIDKEKGHIRILYDEKPQEEFDKHVDKYNT